MKLIVIIIEAKHHINFKHWEYYWCIPYSLLTVNAFVFIFLLSKASSDLKKNETKG